MVSLNAPTCRFYCFSSSLINCDGTPETYTLASLLAIMAQDGKLHVAETRKQRGLDAGTIWNKVFAMLPSAQKSECSFFQTNSHESMWQPALTLDVQPVRYNATPKILPVTYDRLLTFSCHSALVGNSLMRKGEDCESWLLLVGSMIVKPSVQPTWQQSVLS